MAKDQDKWIAVQTYLAQYDDPAMYPSDRAIADALGISNHFVKKVRLDYGAALAEGRDPVAGVSFAASAPHTAPESAPLAFPGGLGWGHVGAAAALLAGALLVYVKRRSVFVQ